MVGALVQDLQHGKYFSLQIYLGDFPCMPLAWLQHILLFQAGIGHSSGRYSGKKGMTSCDWNWNFVHVNMGFLCHVSVVQQ
jgi:hypothetical protein